jgi:epoxyqueuosine reductase QueG
MSTTVSPFRDGNGEIGFAYHGDLISYVTSQLPRQVANKVSVAVESDAYHLRTKARFKDDRGRIHECELEEVQLGSRRMMCRIPENFIAHLSAVV